jgi:hypothetical protein
MSACLGDRLYHTACLAAVVWAAFVFVATATLALPDWTIATPVGAVGALVIWSFGRAAARAVVVNLPRRRKARCS